MAIKNKLCVILLTGMILRAGLLIFFWPQPLTIVDEQHYQQLAENLYHNYEFSLKTGHLTSLRPPLYPLLLSLIYFLTDGVHVNAVRIFQIFLSLGIIYVVFLLGKRLFDEKNGLLAASIFMIYPSFLFFTHLLLTEVFFTLLFLVFIYFFISYLEAVKSTNKVVVPASYQKHGNYECISPVKNICNNYKKLNYRSAFSYAFLSGIFLGLAALTRSILYPFIIIAFIYMVLVTPGTLYQRVKWPFILLLGYSLVVSPWVIRNSILHGQFVAVGTMGGLNFYMGNYEHTPLNRAWAAVDLSEEKAWYHGHKEVLSRMNEAEKQKWATKKAKEFILNHKFLTLKRDLIKAANFWGLERSVLGAILNDHWPALKNVFWLSGIIFLIFGSYSTVILTAVFGLIFNFNSSRTDILFIILISIYFTGMHGLVFGHPRYHLPLIGILVPFSSWGLLRLRLLWQEKNTWAYKISAMVSMIFILIWFREIVLIEAPRFLKRISF
jgi:4-amino-4-deoxy-L-arabinose transferase-like glycosyltransferase